MTTPPLVLSFLFYHKKDHGEKHIAVSKIFAIIKVKSLVGPLKNFPMRELELRRLYN